MRRDLGWRRTGQGFLIPGERRALIGAGRIVLFSGGGGGGGGPATPPTIDASPTIYEAGAAATSHAVAEPAGSGGILILWATQPGATTVSLPGGWTNISAPVHTATFPSGRLCWKAATGGDDGVSVTFGSGSRKLIAGMIRVQGANAVPISGSAAAQDTDTDQTPTCPTMTPADDNCLIIRVFGQSFGDWTEDAGYPGSHTGVFAKSTGTAGAGAEVAGGMAYQTQTTATATGAASFSQGGGNNRRNIGVTFAVRPA